MTKIVKKRDINCKDIDNTESDNQIIDNKVTVNQEIDIKCFERDIGSLTSTTDQPTDIRVHREVTLPKTGYWLRER